MKGLETPARFPIVNTGDILCSTVISGLSVSVICAFPQSPDYTLRVAETLVIRGGVPVLFRIASVALGLLASSQ